MIAVTRQLAAEGASHGIRANAISPGMIATPGAEQNLLAPDHPMRTIADAIPLGRLGTAEDIIPAAVFLCSDEAAYITGANLVVDGGWSVVLPGATTRGGNRVILERAIFAVQPGSEQDFEAAMDQAKEVISQSGASARSGCSAGSSSHRPICC